MDCSIKVPNTFTYNHIDSMQRSDLYGMSLIIITSLPGIIMYILFSRVTVYESQYYSKGPEWIAPVIDPRSISLQWSTNEELAQSNHVHRETTMNREQLI